MGEVKIPAGFTPVSMPDFTHNAFLTLDIADALHMGLRTIIFTFTFVELFDTMGTLVATASKAGLSDEQGEFPGIGKAMAVDAMGVSVGALLGTSTITAFVESAAGAGGKTGLTAVVCGVLFLTELFFTPLVALMMESVRRIDISVILRKCCRRF